MRKKRRHSIIQFIKRNYAVFLILCIIVLQNPVWPLWRLPYMPVSFLFCLLFFIKKNSLKALSGSRLIALLLMGLAFVVLPVIRGGVHGSNIIYILCFIGAMTISFKEATLTLEMISKGLAIIVGISLSAWIIHLGIKPLPLLGTIDLTGMKGNYTVMENYGFFVQNSGANTFRFYSIFDEPGVLGTLGAYVLYANRYQFSKWYNLLILLGCLCTLSAAFYILTIIGIAFTSLGSFRRTLIIIIPLVVIILLGYDFIKENEVFNGFVIDRIKNASESLNDRTGAAVSTYYKNMGILEFLFGIGVPRVEALGLAQGASYKTFIIENGFLSLIILVYAYWKLNKRVNKEVLVFVGLFWLSFLQRPTSFIGWQMLIYACIVTKLAQKGKSRKKKSVKIRGYETKVSNAVAS